jgi:hypothetical protein
MSSFARRQMEKMGWKDGEGLGKNKDGVTTFVRVSRRDPASASGIGHEASKGGSENSDMGLDALLGKIGSKKERTKRPRESGSGGGPSSPDTSSSSSSSEGADNDANGDNLILNWDDRKLFERCGGVRLGSRAGRHRYFNGKLTRIEASDTTTPTQKKNISNAS